MNEDETSSLYDSVSFSERETVPKVTKRTNRIRSTARACGRFFKRIKNNFEFLAKTTIEIVCICIVVVYLFMHRFGRL